MNAESARDFGFHSEFGFPPRRFPESMLKTFAHELDERGVSHNRSAFQDNHAELAQTSGGSAEVTKIIFKPDRFILSHQNVEREGLVIFTQKLEIVSRAVLEKLGVPVFTSQTHALRKLVTPRGGQDARLFLLEAVCGFDTRKRELLGRPLHGNGLRLTFGAVEATDPHEFDVKVESYFRDPRLLYIENQGRFHLPVVMQNLEVVPRNVDRTDDFLRVSVFPFLESFNTAGPGS
jgi:hypothetical protein